MRPMKLNLGSGVKPLTGFVNIDSFPHPRTDLVCDCMTLGEHFKPGTIAEIRSAHFLEHFWLSDLKALLRIIFDLLKPDGLTIHEFPDTCKLARLYISGRMSAAEYMETIFGVEEHRLQYGDQYAHRIALSGDRVAALLLEAGFADPVVAEGHDHRQPWRDAQVTARKPR